jgi:hypothetical protein
MSTPDTKRPSLREDAKAMTEPQRAEFPKGIGEPARQALAIRQLTSLAHLTSVTESELLGMHGIGPKAVRILRDAMSLRGLAFKDSPPRNS